MTKVDKFVLAVLFILTTLYVNLEKSCFRADNNYVENYQNYAKTVQMIQVVSKQDSLLVGERSKGYSLSLSVSA